MTTGDAAAGLLDLPFSRVQLRSTPCLTRTMFSACEEVAAYSCSHFLERFFRKYVIKAEMVFALAELHNRK